jgi:hypothetical protein
MRMGFFYIPHGAIMGNTVHGPQMDRWTPAGAGADFKLSPILASLEPHKKYVTSFGNLQNNAMVGGVHSLAPATWLSGMKPDRGSRGASMSTTLDQVVAKQIGQNTTLPSLEVAAETTQQAAACSGSACFYNTTLSFRDAHSPLPMENNPRKVFIQLFGEGDTPQERTAISDQTRSLLDRVRDRINAMRRDLSAGDRVILDNYVETVREIERRVQLASSRDLSGISVPEAPIGELNQFGSQVDLLFDLIALAYQADLTRVASYIMVAEGTNRTYNHIGVSDSFHPVSHHANDLSRIEKLVKIQTWHVERFAAFIKKLSAIPDGDGSLLDHSMFLYGSNMSNSDRHNGHPLPTILVGGGNGALKGSQHIELREPTPLANVHLTILDKINAKQDSFGDSTGLIAGV